MIVLKQTFKKVIRIMMDHIHLINDCINNNFMEFKFFYNLIIFSLKQVYQSTKSYRCKAFFINLSMCGFVQIGGRLLNGNGQSH